MAHFSPNEISEPVAMFVERERESSTAGLGATEGRLIPVFLALNIYHQQLLKSQPLDHRPELPRGVPEDQAG